MNPASSRPKLIFGSSVEALLRAAHGSIKPETERALDGLRMSFRRPVEPAYPAETWAQAVRLIAQDLYPSESPEEQHRQLGGKTVRQFAETFMGKAMFTAAKVLGAQRSLQRMTNNLRTGANFIETRFTTLDPRTHELWISDVSGVPGFYAGLIEAGADFISGWIDEMRIKERDGTGCLYTLRRTR